MDIAKGLFSAPKGENLLEGEAPEIEIELGISAPLVVVMDDGSVEVTFDDEEAEDSLENAPFPTSHLGVML